MTPEDAAMQQLMAITALTQEQRDIIVKEGVANARPRRREGEPRKGGKLRAWTEYRKMVRDYGVLELFNRGYSPSMIVNELTVRWGVSYEAVRSYIKSALATVAEANEAIKDKWTEVQLERLQKIHSLAVEKNDLKAALGATEQINKITGQYTVKVDQEVKADTTVRFDFGE